MRSSEPREKLLSTFIDLETHIPKDISKHQNELYKQAIDLLQSIQIDNRTYLCFMRCLLLYSKFSNRTLKDDLISFSYGNPKKAILGFNHWINQSIESLVEKIYSDVTILSDALSKSISEKVDETLVWETIPAIFLHFSYGFSSELASYFYMDLASKIEDKHIFATFLLPFFVTSSTFQFVRAVFDALMDSILAGCFDPDELASKILLLIQVKINFLPFPHLNIIYHLKSLWKSDTIVWKFLISAFLPQIKFLYRYHPISTVVDVPFSEISQSIFSRNFQSIDIPHHSRYNLPNPFKISNQPIPISFIFAKTDILPLLEIPVSFSDKYENFKSDFLKNETDPHLLFKIDLYYKSLLFGRHDRIPQNMKLRIRHQFQLNSVSINKIDNIFYPQANVQLPQVSPEIVRLWDAIESDAEKRSRKAKDVFGTKSSNSRGRKVSLGKLPIFPINSSNQMNDNAFLSRPPNVKPFVFAKVEKIKNPNFSKFPPSILSQTEKTIEEPKETPKSQGEPMINEKKNEKQTKDETSKEETSKDETSKEETSKEETSKDETQLYESNDQSNITKHFMDFFHDVKNKEKRVILLDEENEEEEEEETLLEDDAEEDKHTEEEASKETHSQSSESSNDEDIMKKHLMDYMKTLKNNEKQVILLKDEIESLSSDEPTDNETEELEAFPKFESPITPIESEIIPNDQQVEEKPKDPFASFDILPAEEKAKRPLQPKIDTITSMHLKFPVFTIVDQGRRYSNGSTVFVSKRSSSRPTISLREWEENHRIMFHPPENFNSGINNKKHGEMATPRKRHTKQEMFIQPSQMALFLTQPLLPPTGNEFIDYKMASVDKRTLREYGLLKSIKDISQIALKFEDYLLSGAKEMEFNNNKGHIEEGLSVLAQNIAKKKRNTKMPLIGFISINLKNFWETVSNFRGPPILHFWYAIALVDEVENQIIKDFGNKNYSILKQGIQKITHSLTESNVDLISGIHFEEYQVDRIDTEMALLKNFSHKSKFIGRFQVITRALKLNKALSTDKTIRNTLNKAIILMGARKYIVKTIIVFRILLEKNNDVIDPKIIKLWKSLEESFVSVLENEPSLISIFKKD